MKKLTLLAIALVALSGVSAFAYEYRNDNRTAYVAFGRNGLDARVDRLNRMLTHVRWEVSRYRGDWRLRREVDRVATDVNRVNRRYRRGYDTGELRREIDRVRAELRQIEMQLHVRSGDYYRWD